MNIPIGSERGKAKKGSKLKTDEYYMQLMREAFLEFQTDVSQWDHPEYWSGSSSTQNVEVKQTKNVPRGQESPRSVAQREMTVSPEYFLKKGILNEESVTKWSSVAEIDNLVEYEGEDIEVPYVIYHQKMRPALGGWVSARDFVNCRSSKIVDGCLWHVAVGLNEQEYLHPPLETYVRGYLYLTGFHVKPLENNPSQCTVYYVVQTDIGGALPSWIVNKAVVGEMKETFPKMAKLFAE